MVFIVKWCCIKYVTLYYIYIVCVKIYKNDTYNKMKRVTNMKNNILGVTLLWLKINIKEL